MNHRIEIFKAQPHESTPIAILVGELLYEIMNRAHINAFHFDQEETAQRLQEFIEMEKNFVFIAKDNNKIIGFITAYEGFSLYAEGAIGTIAELYVSPMYRSKKIGQMLINTIEDFAKSRNWNRLEVTTPPLPEFDNTMVFYEREGFEISGGRKLKKTL